MPLGDMASTGSPRRRWMAGWAGVGGWARVRHRLRRLQVPEAIRADRPNATALPRRFRRTPAARSAGQAVSARDLLAAREARGVNAKALLLYNPEARHAPDPVALKLLRRRIESCGFAVEEAASTATGELSRLAGSAESEDFDRVVICGGDGSVREAAQGLKGSPVPLAIIPMGTANVLSREIGLPSEKLLECAAIAAKGTPRPVTLGEVEGGGVFTFCASAGIDSLAVASVDLKMKRQTGGWAYIHAGMIGLLERSLPLLRVELDDGSSFSASQVFGLNAGHYGLGALRISRGASLESPAIRLVALAPRLLPRLIALAPRLLGGGFEDGPGVTWRDAGSFKIFSEATFPIQADGDSLSTTPCTVKALPAALSLVFPE